MLSLRLNKNEVHDLPTPKMKRQLFKNIAEEEEQYPPIILDNVDTPINQKKRHNKSTSQYHRKS